MSKRSVTIPAEETFPDAATTEIVYIAQPPARRSGDGYALLGLLAGAVCGAVAGLLLAPRSGDQLRRQLRGTIESAEARPDVPAAAQDAVAQIMQYNAPTTDASARPEAPASAATTPPATAQEK